MGNDGGSISKRDEMVRTKASLEKIDPELLRQSLWTVCTLSRHPLTPPVASCPLGKLYNKDAVVEHLLSRHQNSSDQSSSSNQTQDPIPHIRGLRDLVDLKLTPNKLYRPPSPTSTSSSIDSTNSPYPFMCPLSGKQMDGKQRFVYLSSCGCTMSFTGLLQTTTVTSSSSSASSNPNENQDTPCPVCAKAFNATGLTKARKSSSESAASSARSSVVTINPSSEEEREMREAMDRSRASSSTKKKSKARTADEKDKAATAQNGDADQDGGSEDKAERKRRKTEKKAKAAAETSAKIAALQAELAAEQ